jgi:hypothetical protein
MIDTLYNSSIILHVRELEKTFDNVLRKHSEFEGLNDGVRHATSTRRAHICDIQETVTTCQCRTRYAANQVLTVHPLRSNRIQRLEEVLIALQARRVGARARLHISGLGEVKIDVTGVVRVEVVLRASADNVGV